MNNKQSMKLYTEEQVIQMIEKSRETGLTADYLVATRNGIELPSDDEIWDKADEEDEIGKHYAFIRGAEWMRNKIQGGNNEQQ